MCTMTSAELGDDKGRRLLPDGDESTIADSGYRTMSSRANTATTTGRLAYTTDEELSESSVTDEEDDEDKMQNPAPQLHRNDWFNNSTAQHDTVPENASTPPTVSQALPLEERGEPEGEAAAASAVTDQTRQDIYAEEDLEDTLKEFADIVLNTKYSSSTTSSSNPVPHFVYTPKMSISTPDATRRKSAALYKTPSKSMDEIEAELSQSRPSTARRRNGIDTGGVQLRGDKGKSNRKKSAHSRSSISDRSVNTSQEMPTEWMTMFRIPYKPRAQPTKLVNYQVQPPRLDKLPSVHQTTASSSASSSIENYTNEQANHRYHRHSQQKERITPISDAKLHSRRDKQLSQTAHHHHQPVKSRHVEIHYEDCLPKDIWLEMRPKRFTRNHKHGNHFEIRCKKSQGPASSHTKQTEAEKSREECRPRREAFVWENPYQIWLMEKTHPH